MLKTIGDERTKMSDCETDSCSPSKRARTGSSSSSSSSSDSSVELLAHHQSCLSASSANISLTTASVVEQCQPLSFFLTRVEGIASKFNHSQALDIQGNVFLLQ